MVRFKWTTLTASQFRLGFLEGPEVLILVARHLPGLARPHAGVPLKLTGVYLKLIMRFCFSKHATRQRMEPGLSVAGKFPEFPCREFVVLG